MHDKEDSNSLKVMDFSRDGHLAFDKPTCFFFMVGGLQATRLRVLGIQIL